MKSISLKRHHFPADVIREEVWRYFRLSLSLRDVEELMGHRGADYGALEQTVTFREIALGRKAGWAGVTASHRYRCKTRQSPRSIEADSFGPSLPDVGR